MNEIQKLEKQIWDMNIELAKLRKQNAPVEIKNYTFKTIDGERTLLDLFAGKDQLLVIHNMGQACRYCTLWADGFNGFLPHLESQFSTVLVSKDEPEEQRKFANSRGWRFRMASHGGGSYMHEQIGTGAESNYPGIACYEKKGDKIYKKNSSIFGPGDQFCSFWSIISLAGHNEETFTPQYNYWTKPTKMDDGGKNVL